MAASVVYNMFQYADVLKRWSHKEPGATEVLSKYPDQVTKIINADGGFIEIDDIIIRIGPGCLAKDTEITLITSDPWDIFNKSLLDLDLLQASLRVVEFRPHGLKFLKPVDLTIGFEGAVSDSELFFLYGSWNPEYRKIVWELKTSSISRGRYVKIVVNTKVNGCSWGTLLLARGGWLAKLLSHVNRSFTCRAYSLYRRSSTVAGAIDISVVMLSEFVEEIKQEENIKQLKDHFEAGYVIEEKGMLKRVHTDRLLEMSLDFPGVENIPFTFYVDESQLDSVGFVINHFKAIKLNIPTSGKVKISEVGQNIENRSLWNLNVEVAEGVQTTVDSQIQSMPVICLTSVEKCCKSVCMISLKNEDNDGVKFTGTGWMVRNDGNESYIMTNHHVISMINQRNRQSQRDFKVVIQFDYLANAQPSCGEIDVSTKAEISDENLDFGILKVQSNCPGIHPLNVSTRPPNPNSYVNVIGHSGAEPKSFMRSKALHIPRTRDVSFEEIFKCVEENTKQYCPHQDCKGEKQEVECMHNYRKRSKLEGRKDFVFIYKCGTSQGASGSPVLNDNGEVIAMHSWGMFLGNEQQRKEPALEFAHSMKFIMKHIKENKPALAEKLNIQNLGT